MKAGLFCPSPSSVTMSGALETDTALLMAADLPLVIWCLSSRSQGRAAARSAVSSPEPSSDPSSTTITSKAQTPVRARSISSTSGPMLPASLRTGTTIVT